jgi:hypothetical protein
VRVVFQIFAGSKYAPGRLETFSQNTDIISGQMLRYKNLLSCYLTFVLMDYLHELIIQIELHSVEGINKCFSHGINPNYLCKGEPLIYELTSEYTRTSRFKDCVKAFVDQWLEFEDKILLAVLLNDPI